jgi:hypothetical protein
MGIELNRADGIVFLVVASLNWGAHWFPWAIIPGITNACGRLRRVPAYTHGTLTIIIGCALGALLRVEEGILTVNIWHAVLYLCACACSAGIGTVIPYVIDTLHEKRALTEDVHDLEELARG